LIAGIVFFTAFYDPAEAENQMTAFNRLTATWQSPEDSGQTPLQDFASAVPGNNFTISALMEGSPSVTLQLSRSDYGEPAAPSGAGISVYAPSAHAVYVGYGALLGYTPSNLPQPTVLSARTADGRLLFTASVSMAWSRTYTRPKGGCKYGGRSGSSDCAVYYYPGQQGLCLVVDTSTTPWAVSGGGCAISSSDTEASALSGTTDVVWQRTNQVAYAYTASQQPLTWLPTMPIVVRSSRDPWCYAATATYGSMVFGWRSAQYYQKALVLTCVGAGLMAPAVLFLLGMCCLVAKEACGKMAVGRPFTLGDAGRSLRTRTVSAFQATASVTGKAASATLRTITRRSKKTDAGASPNDRREGGEGLQLSGTNPLAGLRSASAKARAGAGPSLRAQALDDPESMRGGDEEQGRAAGRRGAQRMGGSDEEAEGHDDDDEDYGEEPVQPHSSSLSVPSRAARAMPPRRVRQGEGEKSDEGAAGDRGPAGRTASGGRGPHAQHHLRSAAAAVATTTRNPLRSASRGRGGAASPGRTRFSGAAAALPATASGPPKVRVPRPSTAGSSAAMADALARMHASNASAVARRPSVDATPSAPPTVAAGDAPEGATRDTSSKAVRFAAPYL
jgi:hypothetical protein